MAMGGTVKSAFGVPRCMSAEDKLEIQELKYRHCYATDESDTAAVPELFVEDGVLDIPLKDPLVGHEEIQSYFEWLEEQEYTARAHNLVNPVIDIDGDTATGKWYYMVVYAFPDGDFLLGQGVFDDEFVRTDDGWKIVSVTAKRRITRRVSAERMD